MHKRLLRKDGAYKSIRSYLVFQQICNGLLQITLQCITRPFTLLLMAQAAFRIILKNELQRRVRQNPAYSLRAFAKFLGVHAPVLSEVLRGKRSLPKKKAAFVADKLSLRPADRAQFIDSVHSTKSSIRALLKYSSDLPTQILDEQRHYNIIAEWEYYAVVALLETARYSQKDHKLMAKRLGLPVKRLDFVLEELNTQKIIVCKNQIYLPRPSDLTTSFDIPSSALRQAHKETLKLAQEKIDTVAIEDRFYSSSTVAINPKKINEAKEIIRDFRKRLASLLEEGPKQEVYQIGIQLFPLTELEKADL